MIYLNTNSKLLLPWFATVSLYLIRKLVHTHFFKKFNDQFSYEHIFVQKIKNYCDMMATNFKNCKLFCVLCCMYDNLVLIFNLMAVMTFFYEQLCCVLIRLRNVFFYKFSLIFGKNFLTNKLISVNNFCSNFISLVFLWSI